MKKQSLFALSLALCVVAPSLSAQFFREGGKVVVANRTSGDLTVIDVRTSRVSKTIDLPRKNNRRGEPMYVVQAGREVLVGDRAHDRVLRYDSRSLRLKGEIGVGKGVFHMWSDGRQLWVNNDLDNTTSVIDLRRMRVQKTVKMPADLVARGFKPHDVWVGYGFAWVSLIKATEPGFVIQYSTRSFRELRRAEVGIDPHLWLDRWTGLLAVPAQGSNRVDFLSGLSLRRLHRIAAAGSHGVFSPFISRSLFVTNLPGMGKADLYSMALGFGPFQAPKLVATTDTGSPVAHNIATTPFGTRIFVTHSGAMARDVTIYAPNSLFRPDRGLRKLGTVKAGLNPFGLAYVR